MDACWLRRVLASAPYGAECSADIDRFAGVKVFESATVDTNILLTSKQKGATSETRALTFPKEATSRDLYNLRDFVRQHAAPMTFPSDGSSYIILSPIELSIRRKIEAVGKPLKDWDVKIYRGVLTGCNEAFIITTEKRDELLAQCQTEEERQRTAELIRPILRGRDIKRYSYDWAGLWVINTHNGVKEEGIPPVNIQEYPILKAHLDQYADKLQARADKGDTPYNLRNCAYIKDFDRPKVMWKIIGCNINFAFDRDGMLCNNAVNIMTYSSRPGYQAILL